MARASVSKTEGWGFETLHSCHLPIELRKFNCVIAMVKTKPLDFMRQVRQEIGKVTWPTRKETMVNSIMVIVLSVIAAIFFLAADGLIAFIIGHILG